VKEIKLTQGQIALVDDIDYEWLNQWKWYAQWSEDTKSFYAVRGVRLKSGMKRIWMHRLILDAPKDINGDHKDGNTLNDQRYNLRLDPERRNNQNVGIRSHNTSGFKGVYWYKITSKWKAQIQFKDKKYHLGYFTLKEDAAHAYDKKALELHGEFAKLNFDICSIDMNKQTKE